MDDLPQTTFVRTLPAWDSFRPRPLPPLGPHSPTWALRRSGMLLGNSLLGTVLSTTPALGSAANYTAFSAGWTTWQEWCASEVCLKCPPLRLRSGSAQGLTSPSLG